MLNEIFRLFGTIVVDNGSAKKNIDETVKHADTQQKKLQDKLANFGKTAIKVGTAFAGAAVVVGKALYDVAENTREYRQQMGQLTTAFETNGLSAGQAKNTYEDLYAVLGDTDRSVEAATNIARLSDNTAELQSWVAICTGVYAKFGESLPVETLTESARETAVTGTLTGDLSRALTEAGVSEEEFQKKLDECNNEQERADLIGRTLIGTYGSYAATYRENNKEVMEANRAHENLNSAMAELGEAAEPAVTALTNAAADIARGVVPVLETVIGTIQTLIGWWEELSDIGMKTTGNADLYDAEDNLIDPTITPFMREVYTTEQLRDMGYLPDVPGVSDEPGAVGPSMLKPPMGWSSGLDFVPRDDMPARLHYGEAVLTRSEAEAWRRGQTGGIDYDRLAEAMAARPMAFNIDGKAFAVMLAREMNRAIGNRNIQTLMAMGG